MPHKLLPPGDYRAVAVDGVLGETSTGKEQIVVTFEIVQPEEYAGRRINWYGYFTEKPADRTLESLRYCGWTGNDLSVFEFSSQVNPHSQGFGSQEVFIVVEHEPDQQGVMRARVRWVNATTGGSGVKQKLDAGKAKALAARMKARLALLDQRLKAAAKTEQAAGDGDGDEIPF